VSVGALIGFITTFWQEKLYRQAPHRKREIRKASDFSTSRRKVATHGPEARLFFACGGGIIIVIGEHDATPYLIWQ
jgi:hypothetical protein